MSVQEPQISILDARLAEIDRRLRTIQTGLVDNDAPWSVPTPGPETASLEPELPPRVEVPEPGRALRPAAAEGGGATGDAEPGEAAGLVAELRELAGVHERLLESMRELLSAYEGALARLPAAGPQATSPVRQFSVSAGPFPSTDALRGFERMLAKLPEVQQVEVRGYEGDDRAIVDVHLFEPTS